jgi:hypothetical protein
MKGSCDAWRGVNRLTLKFPEKLSSGLDIGSADTQVACSGRAGRYDLRVGRSCRGKIAERNTNKKTETSNST